MTYLGVLADPDVNSLLHKVSWVLTGARQDPEALSRCLINESERLREDSLDTKFSIITPLWNTSPRYIEQLIASCRMQTYANWELLLVDDGSEKKEHISVIRRFHSVDGRIKLIEEAKNRGISGARNIAIKASSGGYICILDHDDILHPQILGIYARHIAQQNLPQLVYCNELKISDDLTILSEFCSKPEFCFPTLLRTNYICHFAAIRRDSLELIKTKSGDYFQSQFDGVEDHDLFLRLASISGFVASHIPIFGYYWRTAPTSTALNVGVKEGVWQKGKAMLSTHLQAGIFDIAAKDERGGNELFSINFRPSSQSKVAVIIPFKDKASLTIDCLESIEAQDISVQLRVVLVDNNSKNSESVGCLERWSRMQRKHSYSIVSYPGAFNYSKINNWAFFNHCSEQEYILFLNNDVVLKTKNALSAMIGEMQQNSATGVVGIRLHYRDGLALQHGGMGLAMTPSRLYSPLHISGAREFIYDEHIVLSVTFACALVRAETFKLVGGFNEQDFANGLSDVDLCCRFIQNGKKIFYMGTLVGFHSESETRKQHVEDFEIQMLNQRYGGLLTRSHLSQYGYNLVVPLNAGMKEWYAFPLRYRLADLLNDVCKKMLGPVHRVLRRIILSLGKCR